MKTHLIKLSILLIVMLPMFTSVADTRYTGLDILGLAKQNTSTILSVIPENTAIGVLWGTFGDVEKPLRKLLKSGKVNAVRMHMVNGPCIRNNRCEKKQEINIKNLDLMRERVKAYAKIMNDFPTVKCFVSPVLEHDVTDPKLVRSWFKVIDEEMPTCTKVCNAHSGWCPIKTSVLKEKHGNNPGNWDIVSNDGASIFQSNSAEYRKNGKVMNLAWYHEMNLLADGIDAFIPPTKRTCQSTADLYKQALLLLEKPKREPSYNIPQCLTYSDFKNKELLKTNAENYCNSDKRGNRPLLILNKKYNSDIKIITEKSEEIGCFKYYGTYGSDGSQYRYYVGTCSGETPAKLYEEAISENVVFKTEDGVCYRGNTIRRLGFFK